MLFTYGRKQLRIPQMVAGVLFMVYPFFVTSSVGLVVAGIVLGGGLWLVIRMGW